MTETPHNNYDPEELAELAELLGEVIDLSDQVAGRGQRMQFTMPFAPRVGDVKARSINFSTGVTWGNVSHSQTDSVLAIAKFMMAELERVREVTAMLVEEARASTVAVKQARDTAEQMLDDALAQAAEIVGTAKARAQQIVADAEADAVRHRKETTVRRSASGATATTTAVYRPIRLVTGRSLSRAMPPVTPQQRDVVLSACTSLAAIVSRHLDDDIVPQIRMGSIQQATTTAPPGPHRPLIGDEPVSPPSWVGATGEFEAIVAGARQYGVAAAIESSPEVRSRAVFVALPPPSSNSHPGRRQEAGDLEGAGRT